MLSLRGPAEIRAVAARVEYHGDDREKGVTIRLHFAAVPLQVIQDAFVAQLGLFYGTGTESLLPEFEELAVSREVDNVRVEINGVVLDHMQIDHVKLKLLAGRVVDADLKIKGRIDAGMDELHDVLMETTQCELVEKRIELVSVPNRERQLELAAQPA